MHRYAFLLVVILGLPIAAGGGDESSPEPTATLTPSATATATPLPPTPTATPSPPTPTPEASSVEAVAVADSPVGGQLAWILEALNRDDLTEEEVSSHFASSFTDQVSAADIIAVFGQVRVAADEEWTLDRIEGNETDTQMVALITAGGQELEIRIVVEGDHPHLIKELSAGPTKPPTLEDPTHFLGGASGGPRSAGTPGQLSGRRGERRLVSAGLRNK